MKKNIFAGMVAVVFIAGGSVLPFSASAQTSGTIQTQIQELLARITALTDQMKALQGGANATSTGHAQIDFAFSQPGRRICSVLNRNLAAGTRGDDVQSLQEFLSGEGFFTANATGYFGPITAQAVARWQSSQGISAVGMVGPLTRARIQVWCGNPNPTCSPINYMPPLCSDGTAPQATRNESGCTIGYECPVANFTPPANCKAWNDGCNECARTSPDAPAACTMRACFAAGKGYCSVYFSAASNKPPVISSFSGPTTLAVNASGTWMIQASDPENQSLSYSITWGDEYLVPLPYASMGAMSEAFVQTTTFTHAYANAGTYTVTITVRDAAGKDARASATVQVGDGAIVCTMQYDPVCGQPPEPACRHSIPACMMATPGPQTYSNTCMMNAAGATLIHSGQCSTTY